MNTSMDYVRKAAAGCTVLLKKDGSFPLGYITEADGAPEAAETLGAVDAAFKADEAAVAPDASSDSAFVASSSYNVPCGIKIAAYGAGVRHTVMGGTGSGEVNSEWTANIEEGLKQAGFIITSTAWLDAYDRMIANAKKKFAREVRAKATGSYAGKILSCMGTVMPEPEYDIPLEIDSLQKIKTESDFYGTNKNTVNLNDCNSSSAKNGLAHTCQSSDTVTEDCSKANSSGLINNGVSNVTSNQVNAAIYVLSRISGEGADRHPVKGDVFLTDTEVRDILELNAKYERFMLVLNVGGPVDLSPVAHAKNILILSQLGAVTGLVLADILLGKSYPSGKLTTTWAPWKDYQTVGDFGNPDETRYKEGIYVGYRYFDSFPGKSSAEPWDSQLTDDSSVQSVSEKTSESAYFPFGFGLSYADFEIENCCVSALGSKITVKADVKNISHHCQGEEDPQSRRRGSQDGTKSSVPVSQATPETESKFNYAGREVVEVYISCPQGKLDKPYKELAGFAKTKELLPGESETVEINFDLADFASYDEESESYILEAGDYIVGVLQPAAACQEETSAQAGNKNILPCQEETSAQAGDENSLPCQEGAERRWRSISAGRVDSRDEDWQNRRSSSQSGTKSSVHIPQVLRLRETVTTLKCKNVLGKPDFEDLKPDASEKNAAADSSVYITNSCASDGTSEGINVPVINIDASAFTSREVIYKGTGVGTAGQSLKNNLSGISAAKAEIARGLQSENEAEITHSLQSESEIDPRISALTDEELAYLGIGAFNPKAGAMSVVGTASERVAGAAGETCSGLSDKGIKSLIMADGPAGLRLSKDYYRDEKGAHAVGSGNLPETMLMFMSGIEKLAVKLFSGSGSKVPKGTEVLHQYATAIPIGTAIAQSFDLEMTKNLGDIVGSEMEKFGVHLWLAPALNIHRSILCGRNFEYYSEDPVVSGLMAAAIVRGVQKHPSCGATIKHYAANNCEINRAGNDSIVSERAMREIYLKGFRICIQNSGPHALMTSYNLLNGVHTAEHRGLIEDILRSEFGYKGIVMTDWTVQMMVAKGAKHRNSLAGDTMKAGNDVFMPGCKSDYERLLSAIKADAKSRRQAEICASRIARLADNIILQIGCER